QRQMIARRVSHAPNVLDQLPLPLGYGRDMCGRFIQAMELDDYIDFFGAQVVRTESLKQSYNVAPTDLVYGLVDHEDHRTLGAFKWGLIPHYAKNRKTIHINARVESVATKPAFRDSFTRRRCLVPADGFYEWERRPDDTKQPYFISLASGPMAFAGLWTRWRDPDTEERVVTCTVITTKADPAIEGIHDRMPVSLSADLWDDWLDAEQHDVDTLEQILEASQVNGLQFRPVPPLVNSVRNNGPELLAAY
ncbi:MAG: SOS response-associated peptidase, partial [Acidimicrobiia bacterium]|nr:SOS response-associated peptidase [Acidimicrobiia bacterium]